MTNGDISSSTVCVNPPKYEDWLTNELMTYVWDNDESSALGNIPLIIAAYEKRKTFFQRFKSLLRP